MADGFSLNLQEINNDPDALHTLHKCIIVLEAVSRRTWETASSMGIKKKIEIEVEQIRNSLTVCIRMQSALSAFFIIRQNGRHIKTVQCVSTDRVCLI